MTPPIADPEILRELREVLEGLEEVVRALPDASADKPLSEEEKEEKLDLVETHIMEQTDAQAICDLLVLHKIVQYRTRGSSLGDVVDFEARALSCVLHRLAPDTFQEALAIWDEHAEPIDEETD